jgi:hypothetical protein
MGTGQFEGTEQLAGASFPSMRHPSALALLCSV